MLVDNSNLWLLVIAVSLIIISDRLKPSKVLRKAYVPAFGIIGVALLVPHLLAEGGTSYWISLPVYYFLMMMALVFYSRNFRTKDLTNEC